MVESGLRRIKSVEARQGYRLSIAWEKGQASIVDLSGMISKGGVFASLSDKGRFGAVRIGENNRTVEWPHPVDDLGYPLISIDADALFERASQQQVESLASTMRSILDTFKRLKRIPNPVKT